LILHICAAVDWTAAVSGGDAYRAASLDDVGFVHCSDRGTLHLPANALYAGRDDLVLLEIDETMLAAPVRWEPGVPPAPGAPWFPHVYGPIALDAVVAVHEFRPGTDGTFTLPPVLANR